MRDNSNNIAAEMSVLGSVMLDIAAYDKVCGLLHANDFYRPAHRQIWESVGRCWNDHGMCDLILIRDDLISRNQLETIGGEEYLFACLETVPTAANAEHYARVVKKRSQRDSALTVLAMHATELRAESEAGVESIISRCLSELDRVLNSGESGKVLHMGEAYHSVFSQIDDMDGSHGIPLPLSALRNLSVAMNPGEFGVIGARPGIGKSALGYQLLDYAASMGIPGAILSCEMTAEQFAWREIGKLAGIDLRTIFRGEISDHHTHKIAEKIGGCAEKPLYFVDCAGLSMNEIYPLCRRLTAIGVKLFFLDHLQLVTATHPNTPRRDQLGEISRDCKIIARKLNCVMIGLCQLSRAAEKRVEARPNIADLKESGDIEANADFVWLLWRKIAEDPDARYQDVEPAEIIVAKNRMLSTGTAKVGWYGKRFQFVDRIEGEQYGTA